jgi:tRNA(Ile)-lysidine synthase
MTSSSEPIRPHERAAIFAPFARAAARPCALAVSGGVDSRALMVLFADWLRGTGGETARHTVLTVDHGLRPGSAAEAAAVAAAASALGYAHAVLAWTGPKPSTGVQAAARAARYRLMGEHMAGRGIVSLFTAHTRDDQAETLLMRLARGSGLDGLAAMAPSAPLAGCARASARAPAEGCDAPMVLRPLLGVAKARLRATLEAAGVAWVEDPSNQAPAFERSRWRAARAHLDALGLGDDMLALSAARLLRARRGLEMAAARFCEEAEGAVSADANGCIGIDRARLRAAGEEIALRAMRRAIAAAGGSGQPVPLAALENVVAALAGGAVVADARWTLARAMITADAARVVVEREPPRAPLPRLALAPGQSALWDGRFQVSVAADFAGGAIEVRALGEAGLAELSRLAAPASAPPRAAALVPSLWREARLVAVPTLRYWAAPEHRGRLQARFAGLGALGAGASVLERCRAPGS